jgi:hypothetical protein
MKKGNKKPLRKAVVQNQKTRAKRKGKGLIWRIIK